MIGLSLNSKHKTKQPKKKTQRLNLKTQSVQDQSIYFSYCDKIRKHIYTKKKKKKWLWCMIVH